MTMTIHTHRLHALSLLTVSPVYVRTYSNTTIPSLRQPSRPQDLLHSVNPHFPSQNRSSLIKHCTSQYSSSFATTKHVKSGLSRTHMLTKIRTILNLYILTMHSKVPVGRNECTSQAYRSHVPNIQASPFSKCDAVYALL